MLLRVETPSVSGPWSYEVIDAKLARETKGGTVLQLCLYAELLADAQGVRPETSYVVAPHSRLRAATLPDGRLWRLLPPRPRQPGESGRQRRAARPYPDPCDYCDICRWRERCDATAARRTIISRSSPAATKVQIEELKRHGVDTAWRRSRRCRCRSPGSRRAAPSPPMRGSASRRGSRSRDARPGKCCIEFLPAEPGFGLARLPRPSPGDVFFDLEGDPFVGERGVEFLFGYAYAETGRLARLRRRLGAVPRGGKGRVRALRRLRDRASEDAIPTCTSITTRLMSPPR